MLLAKNNVTMFQAKRKTNLLLKETTCIMQKYTDAFRPPNVNVRVNFRDISVKLLKQQNKQLCLKMFI